MAGMKSHALRAKVDIAHIFGDAVALHLPSRCRGLPRRSPLEGFRFVRNSSKLAGCIAPGLFLAIAATSAGVVGT